MEDGQVDTEVRKFNYDDYWRVGGGSQGAFYAPRGTSVDRGIKIFSGCPWATIEELKLTLAWTNALRELKCLLQVEASGITPRWAKLVILATPNDQYMVGVEMEYINAKPWSHRPFEWHYVSKDGYLSDRQTEDGYDGPYAYSKAMLAPFGIDQGDCFTDNFLFGEDKKVYVIDFGRAIEFETEKEQQAA